MKDMCNSPPLMYRQASGVFMGTVHPQSLNLRNDFAFWHEFESLSHMVDEYINKFDLVDTHWRLSANLLLEG